MHETAALQFLLVGFGGVLGSLTRYHLEKYISRRADTTFPAGTFVINISGAFLLGVLTGLCPAGSLYRFAGDGFLGAYTTFSTFMYGTVSLLKNGERKRALLYLAGSPALGVIGYTAGTILAALPLS